MTLALLASFSGDGGMEVLVSNLYHEFLRRRPDTRLLLIRAGGSHFSRIANTPNVSKLGPNSNWLSLIPLALRLYRDPPTVLLAAKHRALIIAILARAMSRAPTRVVGLLGSNKGEYLKRKSVVRRWLWFTTMKVFYPRAELIITMSRGLQDDIHRHSGLSRSRILILPTPVLPADIATRFAQPVSHPWLQPGALPVIIAAGRFTREKSFDTLIRAYAQLQQQYPCRLMILGQGDLLPQYQNLVTTLGLAEQVAFPGFVDNYHAYLAKAALFVLSSSHEGAPNVIIDALACGTPVVATDCPSGPRELLGDGRYGPLVPVGDEHALADAMAQTLRAPPSREFLRAAVVEYTVEKSAARYLAAMGL